ncbi:MAG: hypothetical protein JEZ00_16650 [Anaerolineaceae bacterium]|nr:hypothetical protein [Anaerolineaceae bacterium]
MTEINKKQHNSFTFSRVCKAIFYSMVFVLFVAVNVFAAEPIPYPEFPQNPLQFSHITVNDGLSNDAVQTILQTRNGFVWIGTQNGLNKYNGYDFEIYTADQDSLDALQSNDINVLLEDSNGGLWIGTDNGIDWYSFETGAFIHYSRDDEIGSAISGDQISALLEDSSGMIWIGTRDGGLNRFSPETAQFRIYKQNRFNYHSLSSNTITTLIEDHQGRIWIGTEEGLNLYDAKLDRFDHFIPDDENSPNYPTDYITAMALSPENNLWIGTNGMGLIEFTPDSEHIQRYWSDTSLNYYISSDTILSLLWDTNNQLWIGLDNGLDRMEPLSGSITHLHNAPQSSYWVQNAAVHCLYEDQNGIIWIASDFGGVSKYDPLLDRFLLLQAQKNNPQSLSGNDVTGVTETDQGVLWVSTYGDGITLYDRNTQRYTGLRHNPLDPTSLGSDDIRVLLQSSEGNIWIGTVDNGLDRYRPSTRIFTHFTHKPDSQTSLSENNVTAILEDHAGQIWVGTYANGLNLANPGDRGFTHFRNDPNDVNSIQDDHILTIFEDQQNNMWIGTWGGISVYSPMTGTYRHYESEMNDDQSLSSNMVFAFYQVTPDLMWIGTNGGGVNVLDLETDTFRLLPDPNGLLNVVYAIELASDGTYWFSTDHGIVHYDPFREISNTFDERDGLQANTFNAGAAYQNANGEIYFGGPKGLNVFQPQKIYENSYVAPLAMLKISSGNEVLYRNVAEPMIIEIPYTSSGLTFEFGLLDYCDIEKNEYAYQLVGYDEDWIYVKPGRRYYDQNNIKELDREWYYIGARRVVSYEDLPNGQYTFRVKGSNNDGVWDNEGLSISIIVKPPFWKTGWFPLMLLVFIAGIVSIGYVYRSRRITAANLELESQVKERTAEIRQKQEVAEGLRNILAFINSEQSLEEILDHLAKRSVRLMEADAGIILQFDEDIVIAKGRSGFGVQLLQQMDDDPLTFLKNLFEFAEDRKPVVDTNLQKTIRQKIAADSVEAKKWHEWQLKMGIMFHGLISMPMVVRGGKVAGKLFYFYVNTISLMKREQELTELGVIFADQAALAIENSLLRQTAEMNAIATERNRIARDLHDAVTQTLFSASLVAEALPRVYETDNEDSNSMLTDLQQMTRGALAEMRTLLIELRHTSFDEMPLCDLIRQLAESFVGKLDVPLQVNIDGNEMLQAQVQIAVFRIAQEGLNNIQKHGLAKHVEVTLLYDANQLSLCISDDGCGFDCDEVKPGHMGLKIMRERAQSIGADLKIESKIDHGTEILLSWKLSTYKELYD